MRACASASAIGLALSAALFAACSSGSTPSQPAANAPPPTSPAEPSAAPQPPTAAPQATAAPTAPAPEGATGTPPATPRDCQQLVADLATDPPDGGVVMNNATIPGDAGSSDRLQPLIQTVRARREGFRCCFDIYAQKHPGAQGRVAVRIKLAPDGTVMETALKRDESDVTAPEVESCMAELAKSFLWPKSPSGKETTYTHRFEFKSRQ